MGALLTDAMGEVGAIGLLSSGKLALFFLISILSDFVHKVQKVSTVVSPELGQKRGWEAGKSSHSFPSHPQFLL